MALMHTSEHALKHARELELLVKNKADSVNLDKSETSRENIVDALNIILSRLFPDCWTRGAFLNKDNTDYIIYDLHILDPRSNNPVSSLRLFEFSDFFKIIKV